MARLTRGSALVLTSALAAILVATLRPGFSSEAQSWTNCIICGERGTADAMANVILFAPLGIGLALAHVRLSRALLAGAMLSALIELAQTVIPGRDPSLGDVLFNTVGTGVGYGMTLLAPALARFDDGPAARLSIAAALLVTLGVAATGWLLRPAFPHTAYWGQWTPNLGHLEWYRGRVQSAKIDGMEVQSRRIPDSERVRSALLAGAPIEVQAVAGPAVPALGSLFSVYDENQAEIVLVGPDRDDLVYRYRTRASAWRLDQPDVRLPGRMRGVTPGDPLRVRVWSPGSGNYCLEINAHATCGLGFTVGSGWGILLYAESFPPWLRSLLGAGWLAVLALPLGFLVRARWESAVAVGAAFAGVVLLPGLVALRPTLAAEWGGLAVGLGIGWAAARTLRSSSGTA